jgi:ADP-heptose:LPS heptosyltransferase
MDANDNILLIRLKSIGDVVFMRPAVHLVREAFPDAKITFLTSKDYAPLLEGFQGIDELITVDRTRLRHGNPAHIFLETFTLLRRLRRSQFSVAIDFQGFGETGCLAWLSGAPKRWGSVHCPARRWAFTQGVTRDDQLHPIERNLSFLRQCGLRSQEVVNQFVPPEHCLNEARRFFRAQRLEPARPALFIKPFTSSPLKDWPLDRLLVVARHWRQRGVQVLFGGGPSECAALEPLRQAGYAVAAGVPLLVMAGLMKLSTLVLGGDTGLLHLAVAMEKRVVMVMGSTAPGYAHPFQRRSWAVTPPFGRFAANVGTSAVIDACAAAFGELGLTGMAEASEFVHQLA